ncbi:CDP-alcohol phosphatidyltransferase family protein [Streptomyces sp. MCAF7]
MLNKYARAFFTRVLTPFAALLIRLGVSPDAVTLAGTGGVVAGALVFYPRGEFFWGTVVITLFVFSDLVDGNMARQLGRSSRWGAFLDSTLDRVADGAIFGGLALWYAGNGDDNVLCAVNILLPIALWIVAVGSAVTLIQRVVTVRREAAEADAADRAVVQGGETR